MNFSEQAIALFNDASERLGIFVDWTQENVLPYAQGLCQRIVNYEIATSIFIIVGLLLVSAILGIALYKAYKIYRKLNNSDSYSDEEELYEVVSCILLVFLCISLIADLIFVPVQAFDIITALTIPEKTIIGFLGLAAA